MVPEDNEIIEHHPGKSAGLARDILTLFDGVPVEDMKTVLSGLTISLVSIVMRAKRKYIIVGQKDGIEKMILRWMAALDDVSNLNFKQYINVEKHDD